jgi:hypothetical protein
MLRLLKMLAIVLAVCALIAPISVCADSHDVDPSVDCSCVCHNVPSSNYRENTGQVITPVPQCIVVSEFRHPGLLLAADIFRPPTFA